MSGSPDDRRDEIPLPWVTRARELLAQGPAAAPTAGLRGRIAGALRGQLRRARRIEIAHQHELDTTLVDVVAHLSDDLRDLRRQQAEGEQRGAARDRRADELSRSSADLGRALRAQVRTALHTRPYLAATPFEALDSPAGPALGFTSPETFLAGAADPSGERTDPGHAELEHDRLAPYLALIGDHAPVLGLGARAAELVERLEPDRAMAPAQNSPVDPLAELDGRADGSLGAVFCARLLERLPMTAQWKLLTLALRKLRPGGVFIAETANAHSASAMRMLAFAEQECHPLYPEVALTMCGQTGFAPVFVFAPGHPAFEPARFIAPDFAIVATRPGDGDEAG